MKASDESENLQIKGGCLSCQIEIISGLPTKGQLKHSDQLKEDSIINEPFLFALNDQELEFNKIENSLILVADIQKENWIKVWML